MKFGLGLNVYETVPEVINKSIEAERQELDYIWVSDVPEQRYAPVVASAVAANTSRIRIGLGVLSPFLHTPKQIANSLVTLAEMYGERFELCLGPGDRLQLQRVGVDLNRLKDIPKLLLGAKTKIEETLSKEKIECRIWAAAQGQKMLEISRFFDGVLLNYAHPDIIGWAISKIGLFEESPFQVGVYSPSYIYQSLDPRVHTLLRFASAVVALGAHKTTLERLNLYKEIEAVQTQMAKGAKIPSLIDSIPSKTMELFSIFKSTHELPPYLTTLSKMSVAHVTFAYPQNQSIETIRDLAIAIKSFRNTHKR